MDNGKSLMAIYNEAHDSIIAIMINPKEWETAPKCKNPGNIHKRYERKLASILKPVLSIINKQLQDTHKLVKIKKAVVQCNSLHPRINARLRLPWKMLMKDIPDADTDILCLHPDRPTHILTEILLRLKPYIQQEQKDSKSSISSTSTKTAENVIRKDWIGVLRNAPRHKSLLEDAKKSGAYLCSVNWRSGTKEKTFSKNIREQLEVWREKNGKHAMVPLGEEYPKGKSFDCVTRRVFDWFQKHSDTQNSFYIADFVDSEQLAGISAELEIDEETDVSVLSSFLKDCQWMLNRYVFSLILEVEKTYSGEGPSYPDAYFSYTEVKEDGKKVKRYGMIEDLIEVFTPYDERRNNGNNFNKRYKDCKFNNMDVIGDLFRKIRVHFEITKGEMGKYAIGYKKHAYEVACVVAGIMDVLFYDKSSPIETIVRKCSPGLEEIDARLEKAKVPFLFRQLFKGLSKEDQLFLIPQYREHFIHSFYVFVFGVAMMSYAPAEVIPPSLRFNNKLNDEKKVKELLKKWFLVSMWHDIAYMIEKGNLVLEQHILSLMQSGRREKGLLPWLPSLGNLMQVDGLLDEIRELSEKSIEICPVLIKNISKEIDACEKRDKLTKKERGKLKKKNDDRLKKLPENIVIAAAFERRDHGVWSAMMLNHAWDSDMSKLYFESDDEDDEKLRKEIAKAIIPHHIANWDVREMLGDYDFIKRLPANCTCKQTMEQFSQHCLNSRVQAPSIKCYGKTCTGKPVITMSHKGNKLGYLLGICDMISQAGREDTELPADTSSDLGIQYKEIKEEKIENGILSLLLKYTKKKVSPELFCERYVLPSLFLGLTVDSKIYSSSIRIAITPNSPGNNVFGYFYNPSIKRGG